MQTEYVLRDIAPPRLRTPVQDSSDEALIGLIAEGDKRAMQVLYARHNVRVYRFILRMTANQSLAEDLVSEVFLDVWRQAENFEFEVAGLDLAARDRPLQGAVCSAPAT